MKVIKEIRQSQKFTDKQLTMAFVMVGLGVLGMAIGAYQIIGFGVLFLIISIVSQNKSLIKIFDEHTELKFGPVASTKYIRYTDIQELKEESPTKIILFYKDEDRIKKTRIPVHMIEEKDLSYFTSLVSKHIKAQSKA